MKKILFIDMDNVLVDFPSAFPRLDPAVLEAQTEDRDEIPGIFALMDPLPGAVEAFHRLAELFDTYILSTAPWENPSAWADKLPPKEDMEGAMVGYVFWHDQDVERIVRYCENDVLAVANLLLRLRGEPILPADRLERAS